MKAVAGGAGLRRLVHPYRGRAGADAALRAERGSQIESAGMAIRCVCSLLAPAAALSVSGSSVSSSCATNWHRGSGSYGHFDGAALQGQPCVGPVLLSLRVLAHVRV